MIVREYKAAGNICASYADPVIRQIGFAVRHIYSRDFVQPDCRHTSDLDHAELVFDVEIAGRLIVNTANLHGRASGDYATVRVVNVQKGPTRHVRHVLPL